MTFPTFDVFFLSIFARDGQLRQLAVLFSFSLFIYLCTMVTDSLIRKKFVHETMKEGMQKLQDAWQPAVGAFKVRSGRLSRFANHPAPMTEITSSRYSISYLIPLHLRFLDMRYRRKKGMSVYETKGVRTKDRHNLYNKTVWPILYKEVFPELKFGLTDEVRRSIRQQLQHALDP